MTLSPENLALIKQTLDAVAGHPRRAEIYDEQALAAAGFALQKIEPVGGLVQMRIECRLIPKIDDTLPGPRHEKIYALVLGGGLFNTQGPTTWNDLKDQYNRKLERGDVDWYSDPIDEGGEIFSNILRCGGHRNDILFDISNDVRTQMVAGMLDQAGQATPNATRARRF